ncbi:hypothetical protein BDV24DRAFT_143250 [Aspergillus arachidicola]|uniref:Uncharacterized protein n=1 Tax=Aspergillus arachidicola TaxID=656916 RepID=A0A5N6XU69_9EURO|nr:hypothetical protein BDV24DRAFT_143250 [Aspergillus arachidicola]
MITTSAETVGHVVSEAIRGYATLIITFVFHMKFSLFLSFFEGQYLYTESTG